MKRILFLLALLCVEKALNAQTPYIYTIKADSVKITNTCDTAELIIENHTQNVPGFLYNKGRGRTEFRRVLQKLNNNQYLVGSDTLSFSNAWMQGGNAFGTTSVLGTLDYQDLDIYTNNTQRVRISKDGNMQVNGNLGIGTATITNTGKLIGTNAILFNHFISQYHNYMGNDPFISKLDNVLYNYQTRFNTTTTSGADGSITIDMVIPDHEITPGYHGIVYPQGALCLSFWNNGVPSGVSVQMKNASGSWYGPFTTNTNLSPGGAGFFRIDIPAAFNFVTEVKITIAPGSPGGFINLQNIEWVLDAGPQGLTNGLPFVGKYQEEHLYNYFYFKSGGVDNIRFSPYPTVANYLLNNTLIGSTTDNGNKLQVTGNANVAGNFAVSGNSISFTGLSYNNSATRFLASDANGNLFFRDVSSLAMNETMNSDLAVNGRLSAQKMLITQTGTWPDYVFSKQYQLPSLTEIESFIKQNNHLPGIPSAAEVEKTGVDVGNNQAALLKKIEELTLYTIQQDKELRSLKQEIEELKALIKERK